MHETFWRHHRGGIPCLCAAHAWSAPWGSVFNAQGDLHECFPCAGTGVADLQPCHCRGYGQCGDCDEGMIENAECTRCEGAGWDDADRGYSAAYTAQELVNYMRHHARPGDPTGDPTLGEAEIVVFDGAHVGYGDDGEPLAVPAGAVRWMTWSDLLAEAARAR